MLIKPTAVVSSPPNSSPLIKPDRRNYRIRLSEAVHRRRCRGRPLRAATQCSLKRPGFVWRFIFPVKEPSPVLRLAVHLDQVRPLRSSPVTGLRRYYAPLRLLLRPDRPRRFTACARRRTLPPAGGDLIPYTPNPSGHSTLADPATVMTRHGFVTVSPVDRGVYRYLALAAFAVRGAARLYGICAYEAHILEVDFGCGLPGQPRLLPTCPRGHAVTGPSRPNDLINRMRLSLMDCWFRNRTHGSHG